MFDEMLKEQFFNAYKFSDHDNNKFILQLRKIVYIYEYMDDWKNSMKQCYMKQKILTVS